MPLYVCVGGGGKGEGAVFRSVLNLLDFNLCADCVKFCGTNFVSCVLFFFGHMFLVVALLLFTFLGQLVSLGFSRELNTPYGLVTV